MPKTTCPKCNAEAECFGEDINNWVEFYWEYTLICGSCGSCDKATRYGGSRISVNWETICPFCGKKQSEHQKPPSESPPKRNQ